MSPAEALMGRRLQTRLPVLTTHLQPRQTDQAALRTADAQFKAKFKANHDRQPVLMKQDDDKAWIKPGFIMTTDHENRTYLVKTPEGVTLRRNRRPLQPVPVLPDQPPDVYNESDDPIAPDPDSPEATQAASE